MNPLADGQKFRLTLSKGDAGILETLHVMKAVAIDAAEHDPDVAALAREISAQHADPVARARALYVWLRERVRFKRDPIGIEWVRHPAQVFAQIKSDGRARIDCDCISTLAAAVLRAMNIDAAFVVVGRKRKYEHVYPAARVGGRVIGLDAQEKVPFGSHPPKVARRYVFPA